LGGFCQTAEKVAVSILSMGFFAVFEFFLCFGALHRGKQLIKLQFAVSNAFLCNISWKECKPLRSDVSTGIYTYTELACHFDAYLVSVLKTSHHQVAGFDDSGDIRCSYAISFQWHISAISM